VIEIAFFGQAFTHCEAKESHRGKYATIIAVTDNSEDRDNPSTLLVRLVVPIGLMDEALAIKKGDRIYCEGAASVGAWHTPKGAKPSVSVKVHFIRKARIGEHREAPEVTQEARNIAAALNSPAAKWPDAPAFLARPPQAGTAA
jgi:hypothetical protein